MCDDVPFIGECKMFAKVIGSTIKTSGECDIHSQIVERGMVKFEGQFDRFYLYSEKDIELELYGSVSIGNNQLLKINFNGERTGGSLDLRILRCKVCGVRKWRDKTINCNLYIIDSFVDSIEFEMSLDLLNEWKGGIKMKNRILKELNC